MTSVPQNNVTCESCKQQGPVEEMILKGLRGDGARRYRHREHFGCRARAVILDAETGDALIAIDVRADLFRAAFYEDGRGFNLTALWRQQGRPGNRDPKYWLRTDEGRAWSKVIPDHLSQGRGGAGAPDAGTWIDDIQAALGYAAYLSPALREDIYDVYIRTRLLPTAAPAPLALPDLSTVHKRIDAVHGSVLDTSKKVDRLVEIWQSIDKVHTSTNYPGGVYLARLRLDMLADPAIVLQEHVTGAARYVREKYDLACIGKFTGSTPDARIKQHSGKLPFSMTQRLGFFLTDYPGAAEDYIRNNAPSYPNVIKVRDGAYKDWFWVREDLLKDIIGTWPRGLPLAEVAVHCRGWIFAAQAMYRQEALL